MNALHANGKEPAVTAAIVTPGSRQRLTANGKATGCIQRLLPKLGSNRMRHLKIIRTVSNQPGGARYGKIGVFVT